MIPSASGRHVAPLCGEREGGRWQQQPQEKSRGQESCSGQEASLPCSRQGLEPHHPHVHSQMFEKVFTGVGLCAAAAVLSTELMVWLHPSSYMLFVFLFICLFGRVPYHPDEWISSKIASSGEKRRICIEAYR